MSLGAAAVFSRTERWTACVVAVLVSGIPLMLSGGTGGRFLVPTAGLVLLVSAGLWWRREAAGGSSLGVSVGVSVAVALMAWQAWQAGAVGLAPGEESALSWVWWLLAWPGTGLVTMIVLSGLLAVPRTGQSVRGVGQRLPFAVAVSVAIVLLAWEGRARILEASIVFGLLFGGACAVALGRGRRRSVWTGCVALVCLVSWSGAVRHSQHLRLARDAAAHTKIVAAVG